LEAGGAADLPQERPDRVKELARPGLMHAVTGAFDRDQYQRQCPGIPVFAVAELVRVQVDRSHEPTLTAEVLMHASGEIRVKQEVRKEPEQTKAIGEGWHTDMTCLDEPPKATILFAEQVPPHGGDTQWAGMGPAFEALSEGLRRTLAVACCT
jgi:alpha-ketoglutarate-dependent taurine dioxygenase